MSPSEKNSLGASASSCPWYAGIHLSGSNSHKTAIVVLSGRPLYEPLRVAKVYEKIGSFGSLFSDERLVEILAHMPLLEGIFVDCPLSLPPCVACTRPTCPGAIKCEDVGVAYMLSLSGRVKAKRAQRLRPLNPQSQRLWDAYQIMTKDGPRPEPTYSPNMAPLVSRARVLQRRLHSLTKPLTLHETSAPRVLESIAELIGADESLVRDYRSFEMGLEMREQVLREIVRVGWIDRRTSDDMIETLSHSVEIFHAFLCAWVAGLHGAELTEPPPREFLPNEGWVHKPQLFEPLD